MLLALFLVTMPFRILRAVLTERRAATAPPRGSGGPVPASPALMAVGEGLPAYVRPVMMEYMPTTVRTHQQEAVELPRDKASVQRVLRRHGMKGLSVSLVEDPRRTPHGTTARVYCLTRPRLASDNVMRRRACTVVFAVGADGEPVVRRLDGWIVRDLAPAELWSD